MQETIYNNIKLTKVSDSCIEPSPTSIMHFFCKNSPQFFFLLIFQTNLRNYGPVKFKIYLSSSSTKCSIKTIGIFTQGR